MRPFYTGYLIEPKLGRRDEPGRPGAAQCVVALLALSPLCAVTGLMLAQILGFVPY